MRLKDRIHSCELHPVLVGARSARSRERPCARDAERPPRADRRRRSSAGSASPRGCASAGVSCAVYERDPAMRRRARLPAAHERRRRRGAARLPSRTTSSSSTSRRRARRRRGRVAVVIDSQLQRADVDAAPRAAERRRAPAHRDRPADAATDPARPARRRVQASARGRRLRGARRRRAPAARGRRVRPTAMCWSAPTASARRCAASCCPRSRSSARRRWPRPLRALAAHPGDARRLPDVLLDGFAIARDDAAACWRSARTCRAGRSRRRSPTLAPDIHVDPVEPYMMLSGGVPPGNAVPAPARLDVRHPTGVHEGMLEVVADWHPALRGLVERVELDTLFAFPFRRLDPTPRVADDARHAARRRDPRDAADARPGREHGAARRGAARRPARAAARGERRCSTRSRLRGRRCATTSTRSWRCPQTTAASAAAASGGRRGGMDAARADLRASRRQRRPAAEGRADGRGGRGLEVAMLRLDDLRIPVGPRPARATTTRALVLGHAHGVRRADHQHAGLLPHAARAAEAAVRPRSRAERRRRDLAMEYVRMRDAGETPPVRFPFDERVLKPRVGGFIAVGGALTAHWKTLALPLLHHDDVLDADRDRRPGRLRRRGRAAVDRCSTTRRSRAPNCSAATSRSRLGRAFDDVEYRGEPGHLPDVPSRRDGPASGRRRVRGVRRARAVPRRGRFGLGALQRGGSPAVDPHDRREARALPRDPADGDASVPARRRDRRARAALRGLRPVDQSGAESGSGGRCGR